MTSLLTLRSEKFESLSTFVFRFRRRVKTTSFGLRVESGSYKRLILSSKARARVVFIVSVTVLDWATGSVQGFHGRASPPAALLSRAARKRRARLGRQKAIKQSDRGVRAVQIDWSPSNGADNPEPLLSRSRSHRSASCNSIKLRSTR